MKRYLAAVLLLMLTACGYQARDSEMIGQVKKVVHNTPIVCSEYSEADISLDVIRNGVGSMSRQDVLVTITDKEQEKIFREANETGQLVKVKYDIFRFSMCRPLRTVTLVEVLND